MSPYETIHHHSRTQGNQFRSHHEGCGPGAGVALGTVSKVINGIPVGESYRVRVEESITKLNYRINSYAKSLKSNQAFVIAVLIPNLISPFFAKLANCIHKSLAQRVPEDVQIIGFDGIRHFGDHAYTCSTIVQPLEEIAEVCVNMVLEKEENSTPPLVCLPVTYAWGGTTKK